METYSLTITPTSKQYQELGDLLSLYDFSLIHAYSDMFRTDAPQAILDRACDLLTLPHATLYVDDINDEYEFNHQPPHW